MALCYPPRLMGPDVWRQDDLNRLWRYRWKICRPSLIEALADEKSDAAGEGTLEHLGKLAPLQPFRPARLEQIGRIGDKATVTSYAICALGEGFVG